VHEKVRPFFIAQKASQATTAYPYALPLEGEEEFQCLLHLFGKNLAGEERVATFLLISPRAGYG
jgi:hypothetical protein